MAVDAKTRLNYERRVRELAGLGHRGSTTDGERRGAHYLAAELRSLGLEPDLEPFAGSQFLGARLLLHIGVAASGAGLFWTLPTLGAILGAVALASLIAETSTRWRVLGRSLRGGRPRTSWCGCRRPVARRASGWSFAGTTTRSGPASYGQVGSGIGSRHCNVICPRPPSLRSSRSRSPC